MKKIALYITAILSVFLVACEGNRYDPETDLSIMTRSWCEQYVKQLLDKAFYTDITDTSRVITTSLNDTISVMCRFEHGPKYSDSVDVVSKLVQIGDSIVVTTQGYRYSEKFWAHLYTVDSGIINFDGTFHVDFYETGKTTPWGWGEIKFTPYQDDGYYHNYPYDIYSDAGWY